MEKLSIEEKAKRYNEAIEKLRSLHDDYDTVSTLIDVKEELENSFPELKESEDERMRNAAINACKYMVDDFENSTKQYEDAIAWLEKRGEQNPADNEMKIILQTEYEKGRADAIAEVQKSAWSEVDERLLNDTLDILSSYYSSADDVVLCDNINRAGNWLESIKYRVQPQTKQEWSEEDDEMYKEVLTDIIYAKNDMEEKECLGLSKRAMEAFNWFSKRYKSLTPQTAWKPSEDKFAHIVGCLVQDVVANEHMPEEEKQPTKFFVEKYYKKLREEDV